ncbi:hypothetical protein [Bradyrhizobium sp. SZCCHNR1015]|uniref:hypothetical protein n=1 Tax=Bradyrhizobium sp. SZCCHNR1015 TaxID=3057338 RepID=UPI002915E062|nr:hypothetical protein [Bradyrhizobium sp. SZCCHNR1015]
MSLFIVATNDLTKDQERAFIQFARENGASWWHYLKNLWLLDTPENLTIEAIRDQIMEEIAPGVNVLVFELTGEASWAGFGPDSENRSMFRWIQKHFGSEA